jgi:hypothetical protein
MLLSRNRAADRGETERTRGAIRMTQLQVVVISTFVHCGLGLDNIADRPALFDANKCTCTGELCTCPDAQGVFFTKEQIDTLKALPKPDKKIEIPDTTKG